MQEPIWIGVFETLLNPDYNCEIMLDLCSVKSFKKVSAADQVSKLMSEKPAQAQTNDYLNNLYESIKGQTREKIIAVHMTDPHYDHKYTVGSDIVCNLGMCCRPSNGYPTLDWRKAGNWGFYTCDLPERSIRNML